MADLIKTLHKKGDNTTNIYPNILSDNIPDGAVVESKINDDAVTENKIKNNAITSLKISDGAITSSKISDGAITSSKINDGAVTTNKLSNSAVSTTKIEDGAVSTSKIENGAVTTIKIENGAVEKSKIASNVLNKYRHNYLIDFSGVSTFIVEWVDGKETYYDGQDLDETIYTAINKIVFHFYDLNALASYKLPFRFIDTTGNVFDGTIEIYGISIHADVEDKNATTYSIDICLSNDITDHNYTIDTTAYSDVLIED